MLFYLVWDFAAEKIQFHECTELAWEKQSTEKQLSAPRISRYVWPLSIVPRSEMT